MVHEIPVVKEQADDRADIYIQMVLDKKEEHLIAFHKGTGDKVKSGIFRSGTL